MDKKKKNNVDQLVVKQSLEILGTITRNGVSVDSAVLLGTGEVVDLNGEADALVLDADADTSISAPTDDQIDIEVAGADDFRITANTFTALSGSAIATNTINETTAASGVTIDGVLLKDGGAVFADAATIEVDTINEATSAAGVTIDGALIKDGIVGVIQSITGDGAITIAPKSLVYLSKASAGAITLAAPTSGTHDGYEITVVSMTAQAHVITGGVVGFNAKGSSGTATFGGAIGDSVTFVARTGNWYTKTKINVTIA
jgi:hypothetical protein